MTTYRLVLRPKRRVGYGRKRKVHRRVGRPRKYRKVLRVGRGRKRVYRRRRVMGRGIFQDIGNKLREAHDYLKSNRVISQGLQKVAKSGVLGSYSGISRAAGNLAGALGYGRRRKRYGRRRVMGRGISSQVSSSVRRIIF